MGIGHKRLATVVAGVLILVGIAAGAPGRTAGGGLGRRHRWQDARSQQPWPGTLPSIVRRLELTDEQIEKVRDIVRKSRAEAREADKIVTEASKALRQSVRDGAEEAQIRAAAQTLAKAIEDQAVGRGRVHTAIKAVLTDEQRQKLGKLKQRAGQLRRRAERRGRTERFSRRLHAGGRAGQSVPGWQRRGPNGLRWAPAMGGAFRGSRRSSARWGGGRPFAGRSGRGGRQVHRPLPTERAFERLDTNNDDAISREELDAFRDEMRTRRESRPW
jgi:Spy/CpxP family protein refolding chaperone